MVVAHWHLEGRLARELLASRPEDRWEVFERCYSALYQELPWLAEQSGSALSTDAAHEVWKSYIGPAPKAVYEVGSGTGALAHYLAENGYRVRASEITRQRGGRHRTSEAPGVTWGETDGVHLDRFELPESYDAAISDQVIEHLHPDDLPTHFRAAWRVLRPGGRYVFSTPHAHAGPSDVSRVFGFDRPLGMHLKEYTYRELREAVLRAGFSAVAAPLRLPRQARMLLGGRPTPRPSPLYLGYLVAVEAVVGVLPAQRWRRAAARLLRPLLFAANTVLIAEKHASAAPPPVRAR